MREIDISTIMKQLGFSPFQLERWQQIQQKSKSQLPEFAGAQIVNLTTPPIVHNASIYPTNEPIVV